MNNLYFDIIIKVIGLYDIVSGLLISYSPHIYMLNKNIDDFHLRLFQYWVITYGLIRLLAPLHIAYFTLIIEAIFLSNELYYNDFAKNKLLFCIIICILLYIIFIINDKKFCHFL